MKKQLLNKDGLPVFLHDDHKKPVTRRDFLSTGLLSFSGYMFAPSILQTVFMSQAAQAAGCAAQTTNTLPAFMSLNFAGGPGMTGTIVPMGQDGSTLPSYSSVGLGQAPGIQTVFNGVPVPVYNSGDVNGTTNKPISPVSPITATTPPSVNLPAGAADPTLPYISQFFQGLLLAINPDIQSKTAWCTVLVSSQDDSSSNACNISGMVQAAGYAGDTLPALGTNPTATGLPNLAANTTPSAPAVVGQFSDITNAISLHQKVQAQLNNDPKLFQSMLNLINNLSGSQARTLASVNGSNSASTLSNLVSCATGKNYDLSTSGTTALDPKNNASVSSIWGLGSNTTMASMTNAQRYTYSAMVWNLLQGHSGTVGISLGGNDYHGNPRTTTDLVDFRNGTMVGNILATAAALGKPIFIHITADGATGSQVSSSVSDWSGDRGIGGAQFMVAYSPTGRPGIQPGFAGNQLGNFTNSQGADSTAVIGSDPTRAATAVFRNYLQFAAGSKAQSIFNTIIPAQTSADFDTPTLAQILKFT